MGFKSAGSETKTTGWLIYSWWWQRWHARQMLAVKIPVFPCLLTTASVCACLPPKPQSPVPVSLPLQRANICHFLARVGLVQAEADTCRSQGRQTAPCHDQFESQGRQKPQSPAQLILCLQGQHLGGCLLLTSVHFASYSRSWPCCFSLQ